MKHISLFQSFQILFFSVFLFLCSTFPVFNFLSFSSVFLCISSTFFLLLSLSLCLLLSFLLPSIFLLDFLCLSSNFSFCFYLFLCLLLSFLAFFNSHSLPIFFYVPLNVLLFSTSSRYLFSLFFLFLLLSFYPSVLLFCIF